MKNDEKPWTWSFRGGLCASLEPILSQLIGQSSEAAASQAACPPPPWSTHGWCPRCLSSYRISCSSGSIFWRNLKPKGPRRSPPQGLAHVFSRAWHTLVARIPPQKGAPNDRRPWSPIVSRPFRDPSGTLRPLEEQQIVPGADDLLLRGLKAGTAQIFGLGVVEAPPPGSATAGSAHLGLTHRLAGTRPYSAPRRESRLRTAPTTRAWQGLCGPRKQRGPWTETLRGPEPRDVAAALRPGSYTGSLGPSKALRREVLQVQLSRSPDLPLDLPAVSLERLHIDFATGASNPKRFRCTRRSKGSFLSATWRTTAAASFASSGHLRMRRPWPHTPKPPFSALFAL